MAGTALSVKGLTKSYGDLRAVDDVSFDVERGEVFGFLGPNGAGKSTTIKMILGLTAPDSGVVRVLGRDLKQDPHEVKRRIGYLPERVAFYNNLTALQTLEFYADMKGAKRDGLGDLLESVGLGKFADKRVGTFSKGMTQLVGVAQALIGSPDLLILDEPTAGLDPNWSRMVKDRVNEAAARGTTVFFSSHILPEVQELARRVVILWRGKVVAMDDVSSLQSKVRRKPQLRLTIGAGRSKAVDIVSAMEGVEDVRVEGADLVLSCPSEVKTKVVAALSAQGIDVQDFRTVEPSLEDVFLSFTQAGKGAVR